jgi:hypothetical protein
MACSWCAWVLPLLIAIQIDAESDRIDQLPTDIELAGLRRKLVEVVQDLPSLDSTHRRTVHQLATLRLAARHRSAISLLELGEDAASASSLDASDAEELDIQPVMKSITKLEHKIKSEHKIDSDSHALLEETCMATDRKLAIVLADEEASQKRLKMEERQARNDRSAARADLKVSQETERELSKSLDEIRSERQAQMEAYYARRRQRTIDLKALHAATRLVCTFASFTDDERCKRDKFVAEVQDPGTTELFASQSLQELKAESKQVIAAQEAAWEEQQAKDQADIHKGTIPGDYIYGELKATNLLQLARQSAATDKQLRGHLANDPLTDQSRGPLAALLLAVEAGDYEKAESLLELILGIISQVTEEQRQDKADWESTQMQLDTSERQTDAALKAEQNKQTQLEQRIKTLSASIEDGRALFFRSVKAAADMATQRQQNNLMCEAERTAYGQRKQVADEELMNINKLRSLLQVLDGTGVPTCDGDMADCTASDQGMCIYKNADESICACEPGYYGVACEHKKCPGHGDLLYKHDEAGACSSDARGKCDKTTGNCLCTDQFEGDKCQFAKGCPGGGQCNNGHGRCDKLTGKCSCYPGWYGDGCTERKCKGPSIGNAAQLYTNLQEEVCSGHGVCDTSEGQCRCHEGWEGGGCESKKCHDNCSGNGSCLKQSGQCSCKQGHHGPTCAFKECPGDCGGFGGSCNRLSGQCICNPGFSGPQCDKTHTCDERETTYHEWAFWKEGWSKCPYGWLMTGLVTGQCTGIHCLDKAVCARPCLGKDRLRLSSCYQENWWDSLNTKGWNRCSEGYYMAGMYRNKCNSLYCIEMGYCCSIREAEYDHCTQTNWFDQIKNTEATVKVPASKFMTGVYRAGLTTQISDLREVASCHFKSVAQA